MIAALPDIEPDENLTDDYVFVQEGARARDHVLGEVAEETQRKHERRVVAVRRRDL